MIADGLLMGFKGEWMTALKWMNGSLYRSNGKSVDIASVPSRD